MDFVSPLNLEMLFLNIFSGTPEIFSAIAIIVISTMCGFFRMNSISMFFMLGIFILMFSGFIGANLLILFGIFGGLIIGYSLSRMFS